MNKSLTSSLLLGIGFTLTVGILSALILFVPDLNSSSEKYFDKEAVLVSEVIGRSLICAAVNVLFFTAFYFINRWLIKSSPARINIRMNTLFFFSLSCIISWILSLLFLYDFFLRMHPPTSGY